MTHDWRHDAACAEIDPEVFFPFKTDDADVPKKVCRRCPVKTNCLNEALEGGMDSGVWGGLDENERRELRRSTLKPKIGTVRKDGLYTHR